jgi:uncharacterized protein (DUF433 family)
MELRTNKHRDLTLYGGRDPRELPIYTIEEASKCVHVPVSTIRNWVFGGAWSDADTGIQRHYKALLVPSDPKRRMLSFVNLVELHVLSAIRRLYKIKMYKTRDAIVKMRKRFETRHPLAEIDIESDSINLFVQDSGHLINITADEQLAMLELVRAHLRRIERIDGVASRLYPFTRLPKISAGQIEEVPKYIAIDPFVSFGRPVIAGTRVPTEIIAERWDAGDSIVDLAEDYELNIIEIDDALRFERSRHISA